MNSNLDNSIKTCYENAINNKFNSFVNWIALNSIILLFIYFSTISNFIAVIVTIPMVLGLGGMFCLNEENYKLHLKHTYTIYKIPMELLYQCVVFWMIYKFGFDIPIIIISLVVIDTLLYIKGFVMFVKMKLCRELE